VCCKAQGVPGAGGRNGFVIVRRDHLVFTYDRWGSSRIWQIPRARIPGAYLRQRALMDVLEVHYYDEQNPSQWRHRDEAFWSAFPANLPMPVGMRSLFRMGQPKPKWRDEASSLSSMD
jgi:hypothetical protein